MFLIPWHSSPSSQLLNSDLLHPDLFAPYTQQARSFAVAVSGGPDSLTLTLLLHHHLSARGKKLIALTCDHGLRKESALEAAHVHHFLTQKGLTHHVLTLKGLKGGHLQARSARYHALTTWCHTKNIKHLFLGHHADDQLETFSMRLSKNSHPTGLQGMDFVSWRAGIWLMRPFISLKRLDIAHLAKALNLPFVNDPSNHHKRYERTRVRHQLKKLSPSSEAFWHQTHKRLHHQASCHKTQALKVLQKTIHAQKHQPLFKKGVLRLPFSFFQPLASLTPPIHDSAPRALSTRTLSTRALSSSIRRLDAGLFHASLFFLKELILTWGGPHARPFSASRLINFSHVLTKPLFSSKLTFGGILWTLDHKNQTLNLQREWQRIAPYILTSSDKNGFVWDNRFFLKIKPYWFQEGDTIIPISEALKRLPQKLRSPAHKLRPPAHTLQLDAPFLLKTSTTTGASALLCLDHHDLLCPQDPFQAYTFLSPQRFLETPAIHRRDGSPHHLDQR